MPICIGTRRRRSTSATRHQRRCEALWDILGRHGKKVGVAGYTEIPEVHGVGETGIRMGSSAHPETSSLFFTIVDGDKVAELKEAMCSYCGAYDRHMKMVQWGVEEIV